MTVAPSIQAKERLTGRAKGEIFSIDHGTIDMASVIHLNCTRDTFGRTFAALFALLAGLALLPRAALAQVGPEVCEGLSNGGNGPFDYRSGTSYLKGMESVHFTDKVERLIAGSTGSLGQDIEYMLRAYPNHHRALLAMMGLAKRSKSPVAAHMKLPAECYFERALRFKKDDTTARMLFATYLTEVKRTDDAVKQLDLAAEIGKENPFTQYNVGMVFSDMARWDRALAQAHIAMAQGFSRPELKRRLVAAGKWVEPSPSEATANPASVSASSPASGASN